MTLKGFKEQIVRTVDKIYRDKNHSDRRRNGRPYMNNKWFKIRMPY